MTKYNQFINAIESDELAGEEFTYTENGALTNATSGSALVDFFANFASYRNVSENDILQLFLRAFNENRTSALRLLFYARTPRNGQGEKRVFQIIMKYLAMTYPEWVLQNLDNIIDFGYWKDLYIFHDVNSVFWYEIVWYWMRRIMNGDLLAAKYAPTETNDKKGDKSKNKYVEDFVLSMYGDTSNTSKKKYRKHISSMRQNAKIVERLMSLGQWSDIHYESVPSQAHKNYNKAFAKRDAERYAQYLKEVSEGTKTIKTGTLNPVELVKKYDVEHDINQTYELMWSNLQNYFAETTRSIVPVLDCSGSMLSSSFGIAPKYAAQGLGIYCMQRNSNNVFRNKYITFSENTRWHTLKSNTLYDAINEIERNSEVANTNIQKVFDLVLQIAQQNKLNQNDLPELLIISDMQFDEADNNTETNYQAAQRKYKIAGYELPRIWFWNVDRKPSDYPVMADTPNTYLLSGYSPSIIKTILTGEFTAEPTPYELMMNVVNREDLQCIKW